MRRLASILMIGMLAALVPVAAAHAAPTAQVGMGNVSLAPGGVTKRLDAGFAPADGQVPAAPFAFVFDIAAVAELATIEPLRPCTVSATTMTCPVAPEDNYEMPLALTAKPDAKIGAFAALTVRVVLDGRTLARGTSRVTIAEGVELAATEPIGAISVPTGETVELNAGVRNAGERAVTGVVMAFTADDGIEPAHYRNCVAIDLGAACTFDSELAPGQEYRLSSPFRVTATDALWAPSKWNVTIAWSTAQDYADRGGPLPSGGDGPELTLVAAPAALGVPQTDVDPWSDYAFGTIEITGDNRSNVTAIGARARAEVGQTITVRIGVRNNGPASLIGYGRELGSYLTVGMTPPAGTTVVKVPTLCEPFNMGDLIPPPWPPGANYDDGNFYCFGGPYYDSGYAPRETVTWEFRLRIDKPGALRGRIFTQVITPKNAPKGDPVPSDDTAAIVITAAAVDTGGEGGSDGGGLPITGSDTTAIALIGLALLLAGAVTVQVTRPRR
jgi:hypothetical protein